MDNTPAERHVIVQISLSISSDLPDSELIEAAHKGIYEYARKSHSRDALASVSVSNNSLAVYHSHWTHHLLNGNCQVSIR